MSKLTDDMLRRIMPLAPAARRAKYLPFFNEAAAFFRINTAERMRHWLATIAVESGELRYTSELGVHPEYEGRTDLGNTQRGDGVLFEGHGLIQLTGRDVHEAFAAYIGAPELVRHPERIADDPKYAVFSAAWFVSVYKPLNALADKRKFLEYQVRVNGRNRKTGKPNHWNERCMYYERACRAIPDDWVLGDTALPVVSAQADTYPDFARVEKRPVLDAELESLSKPSETIQSGETGVSAPNSPMPSNSVPVEIGKEQPSTFRRWLTAIKVGVGGTIAGGSAYCGGSEVQTIVTNKAAEHVDTLFPLLGWVLLYTALGLAAGIALIWVASHFYDKSARRAAELTQAKLRAAADVTSNTVEVRQ